MIVVSLLAVITTMMDVVLCNFMSSLYRVVLASLAPFS
uniref:Uncharacterized protein n=1 Tax=Lepeophtheirus salmonis TaxID=72036 RepID=A0A0K2UX90_LEPSM